MLRKAHGRGAAALLRVENPPVDELPAGVAADTQVERPGDRKPSGQFAPGNSLSRVGGRAKRGRTRLAAQLGLSRLPEGADFAPYKASAATFRRVQCADLAATVGGGICGPGPSSIVASAALALAWSRYFSDVAARVGDSEFAVQAIRCGEASRQALLTAHALCAR